MTSSTSLRLALAFCLGILAIAPSSASAQGPTAEQRTRARQLYTEGQAHFTAHEYQQALDAFQGAFREVPNPVVLLGVASAQEQLGQREQARATLEQYLVLRPDAPDRTSIEQRIAALPAASTGTVHVACTPAGASIELDGHTVGTGEAETTATPGTHEIRVSLAGHAPITRSIEVQAGHRIDLELTLVADAQVATTDSSTTVASSEGGGDEMSEEDVFGTTGGDETTTDETTDETTEAPASHDPSAGVWVTTAIAGVALVTGTIFGFLALSKQSDFDAMPTVAAANDGEAFALVADISFAAAAAAGITAIVLYATEQPAQSSSSDATSASLTIVPVASPTSAGVAVGGRF